MPVVRASAIYNGLLHSDAFNLQKTSSNGTNRAPSMAWSITYPSSLRYSGFLDSRGLSHSPVGTVLTHHQRVSIQYLTTASSTISLLVGLTTLYWFLVMRRSYRHRLIFFVICGDLFRSIWYFVFGWVSIATGPIETSRKLCQATGFFVQTGNEISDFATFSISIHTALLIFKPWQRILGDDGLYPFRHAVAGITIGLPLVMASIAFANHGQGYSAQLPICTLPVRPFWYRLALMWVPRYVMWIIVLGLAIYVYRYVGGKFGMFAVGTVSSTAVAVTASHTNIGPSVNGTTMNNKTAPTHEVSTTDEMGDTSLASRRKSRSSSVGTLASIDRELDQSQRLDFFQESGNISESEGLEPEIGETITKDLHAPVQRDAIANYQFTPAVSTSKIARTLNTNDGPGAKPNQWLPALDKITEDRYAPVHIAADHEKKLGQPLHALSVDPTLARRRHAIIHQLRLLFIYPILYIILWILPFILHCYQYNDYYAAHPPFALALLAYFALAIMGAVNGIVFNLKERPWRHISGSEGSFWGSFCWWRRRSANVVQPTSQHKAQANVDTMVTGTGGSTTTVSLKKQNSFPGSAAAVPPPGSLGARRPTFRRQTSRTEVERRQAEQAYTRLAAEMADRQQDQNNDTWTPSLNQVSELGRSNLNTVPIRPRLDWWDKMSGLTEFSNEDEAGREASTSRPDSVDPEQARRQSAVPMI